MAVIPGIPARAFSMGWVTRASTCSGERPVASVWTTTSGGAKSGNTSYLAPLNPYSP